MTWRDMWHMKHEDNYLVKCGQQVQLRHPRVGPDTHSDPYEMGARRVDGHEAPSPPKKNNINTTIKKSCFPNKANLLLFLHFFNCCSYPHPHSVSSICGICFWGPLLKWNPLTFPGLFTMRNQAMHPSFNLFWHKLQTAHVHGPLVFMVCYSASQIYSLEARLMSCNGLWGLPLLIKSNDFLQKHGKNAICKTTIFLSLSLSLTYQKSTVLLLISHSPGLRVLCYSLRLTMQRQGIHHTKYLNC